MRSWPASLPWRCGSRPVRLSGHPGGPRHVLRPHGNCRVYVSLRVAAPQLGVIFQEVQLYACFVVSPVTYTSVTVINRKSPLEMSKISCFFPHPLPALKHREDLNSVLPGRLSCWVRLPEKSNAKTNSPFTSKAVASLPRIFGILALSCNYTVGCLGL